MTLFDRLAKFAGVAVDRGVGEPVRISPRYTAPKRSPSDDPDRPVVELTARFTLEPQSIEIEGQRRGTDLGGFTVLQGAEAVLVLSPGEAEKLSYRLRTGDLVQLLSPARAALPLWSVLAPLASAGPLLVVTLTRDS